MRQTFHTRHFVTATKSVVHVQSPPGICNQIFCRWREMSCSSCQGCFAGNGCVQKTSDGKKTRAQQFSRLVEKVATRKDLIPSLISEMSHNVYASQMALYGMHQQLSHQLFLELVLQLHQRDIVGLLIAWAWEYVSNDAYQLMSVLSTTTENQTTFWDHLERQAELHEVINQLPTGSAGRVKRAL